MNSRKPFFRFSLKFLLGLVTVCACTISGFYTWKKYDAWRRYIPVEHLIERPKYFHGSDEPVFTGIVVGFDKDAIAATKSEFRTQKQKVRRLEAKRAKYRSEPRSKVEYDTQTLLEEPSQYLYEYADESLRKLLRPHADELVPELKKRLTNNRYLSQEYYARILTLLGDRSGFDWAMEKFRTAAEKGRIGDSPTLLSVVGDKNAAKWDPEDEAWNLFRPCLQGVRPIRIADKADGAFPKQMGQYIVDKATDKNLTIDDQLNWVEAAFKMPVDPKHLNALQFFFVDGHSKSDTIGFGYPSEFLEHCVLNGEPEIKARAIELAKLNVLGQTRFNFDYLSILIRLSGVEPMYNQSPSPPKLSASLDKSWIPYFESVLDSDDKSVRRVDCAHAILQLLDRDEAKTRALSWLADSRLRPASIKYLTENNANSNDRSIVEALKGQLIKTLAPAETPDCSNRRTVMSNKQIAVAIYKVGAPEAREVLREHPCGENRLDFDSDSFMSILHRYGVGKNVDVEACLKKFANSNNWFHPDLMTEKACVITLLEEAGIYKKISESHSMRSMPKTLSQLADISDGLFAASTVVGEDDFGRQEVSIGELQFVVGNHHHKTSAEFRLEIPTCDVLNLANSVLKRKNDKRRFESLLDTYESSHVVFGDPEMLEELLKDYDFGQN